MFESKTITRNEQTLFIDDAQMIGIMPTGGEDSSYVVNFKMDRDGVETHLHIHLHRSHIEAIKGAQVLTVPQLRAVHAKAAQAEEVSKESPKPQAEVVEIPKNTPLTIEGKITVLEPGPAEEVNWKDPKLKHHQNVSKSLVASLIKRSKNLCIRCFSGLGAGVTTKDATVPMCP